MNALSISNWRPRKADEIYKSVRRLLHNFACFHQGVYGLAEVKEKNHYNYNTNYPCKISCYSTHCKQHEILLKISKDLSHIEL